MLDDAREALAAALRLDGKRANTTDPAAIARAKERLIAQKKHLLKYESQPKADLIKGDVWLCQCFSGDALQARAENAAIAYVIPKEGATIWVDSMSIPKTAKNRELAHRFIDFVLRPEVSARLANAIGYANPNEAARPFTEERVLQDPVAYPPEADVARCERLVDIGKANQALQDAWEEVRRK